ncbi:bifunctional 2-C-methyl-D-erythritol 4-phosphate cytidylyltransferase/2-C-methyl-D-erythritol 2,4-cyclodiphosphate synthase [Hellea sp.]|nr:bifunctional 2-C-methyl-D-erythritol 4-phosphate cytidylyltransferase/2-C-methyl-D-erythritol 2,4-cyclodiphosphate synthase [Hellea sp.]MDA8888656.1 bifunctional 2-C-methyl-D-erythritol 4-phosphate cytidylyltransferase/2-C-methyl-D-erythritol 2,4-cyclodiphosphate synthase [Hellea sp.]MDB4844358.1 bifunctional 2-C-methyl-D-erythritol 4-phosphate cytidylyltransferase/2-C-methyl-D-erythritol 2,4-cyclodiphosphate synthase [Hellea sp.]MDC1062091.1 bifunctional 2-C-methyl-D-erythritol 4-phosphate c
MTRIAQIIVAAGKGARLGGTIPKQYLKLAGKLLIEHTISAMNSTDLIDETIIVVAKKDKIISDIISRYKNIRIVIGGDTRAKSSLAGLLSLSNKPPDIVLIHDAARPFVSKSTVVDIISNLKENTAVAPALPVVNALKTIDGIKIDRKSLFRIQTPQGFNYKEITQAYNNLSQNITPDDDIEVAKLSGINICYSEGDTNNFKVTYPKDFERAKKMISLNNYIATGNGFDVHQLATGDKVWLCGVPIKCEFSLLGHSDADVALHALTDAILGTIALGDIGDHFPPTDPQWMNAKSEKFLLFALSELKKRGGVLQHLDVTIICENPKIKPYRQSMRDKLSQICNLPIKKISVKATTTEKLGFTGRSEGIAAQATATVKLPE